MANGPLPPTDPSQRIFHYTNAAGLLGILQSQAIWATDTNNLNDTKEVIGSIDQLIMRVEQRINDIDNEPPDVNQSNPPSSSTHRRNIAREALAALNDIKRGIDQPDLLPAGVFVASLSANGDLIPLWDRYIGTRVEGYAIAFKPGSIDQVRMTINDREGPLDVYTPRPRAVLREVIYGDPGLAYDAVVDRMIPPVIAGSDDRGAGKMRAAGVALEALAMVKTSHWSSEEEWRTIFVRDSRQPQVPPVRFRADPSGHLGIIPFIEISFGNALNASRFTEAIDGIVLSPYGAQFAVRERNLRTLLNSLSLQHVKVWWSESSAR